MSTHPCCKSGAVVKLTKISGEGGSLPIGYWAKGELLSPVTVNGFLYLLRSSRAGREGEPEVVNAVGVFESSLIVGISEESSTQVNVATNNSVWRVELE